MEKIRRQTHLQKGPTQESGKANTRPTVAERKKLKVCHEHSALLRASFAHLAEWQIENGFVARTDRDDEIIPQCDETVLLRCVSNHGIRLVAK